MLYRDKIGIVRYEIFSRTANTDSRRWHFRPLVCMIRSKFGAGSGHASLRRCREGQCYGAYSTNHAISEWNVIIAQGVMVGEKLCGNDFICL